MLSEQFTTYQLDDCTFPASPPDLMPSPEYNQALRLFIRVCADIILYDSENKVVCLAKRNICLPVWWFIGGQIWPGEPALTGALRRLKIETSLTVEPNRLEFLCINRYLHSGPLGQPARDNFTCTFALNTSPTEINQAENNLDPNEYDTNLGIRSFGRTDLAEASIAQPIIDIYEKLFPDNG